MPTQQYTVDEILDWNTENVIQARTFFQREAYEITPEREKLWQHLKHEKAPYLVCLYCKQKVYIRGGGASTGKNKKGYHFAHPKHLGKNCEISTQGQLTKAEYNRLQYNGQKEGPLHRHLKHQIAHFLQRNEQRQKGITKVEIEPVKKDQQVTKRWRKPDIHALHRNRKIAIELQLSTTWLDVILERQAFYPAQQTYILWVFHEFEEEDDERKMTFTDVIYTNHHNAFVLDHEAIRLSTERDDLVLNCYYKVYERNGEEITSRWAQQMVTLDELKFDADTFQVYFYPSRKKLQSIKAAIKKEKKARKKARKRVRKAKIKWQEKAVELTEQKQGLEAEITSLDKRIDDYDQDIAAYQRIKTWVEENPKDIDQETARIFKEMETPFFASMQYSGLRAFFEKNGPEKKQLRLAVEAAQKDVREKQRKVEKLKALPEYAYEGTTYRVLDSGAHRKFIERNWSSVLIVRTEGKGSLFQSVTVQSPGGNLTPDWVLTNQNTYTVIYDFSAGLEQIAAEIAGLEIQLQSHKDKLEAIRSQLITQLKSAAEEDYNNHRKKIDSIPTLKQERKTLAEELEEKEAALETIREKISLHDQSFSGSTPE